jgi:hypothetical protein
VTTRSWHPLIWRRLTMGDCDCCEELGQQCTACGWHEGADNGPELHETHMQHILADQAQRESEAQEI